jgi:sugar-specific transcriptional regulator TrmB
MEKRLILKRFKDMGLTSYEVKCYLSLLERDTLTVSEVSKLAAIPRPNAYEALEKLMSKGLCAAKPGATKQYSASDPSLLEENLLVQLQEEAETEMDDLKEDLTRRLKRKEKEILERTEAARQNVGKLITELRPQYDKSRLETNPMDYIEIIKDPTQIHRRFIELIGAVQENLVGFTKPPWTVQRKKYNEQVNPQSEAVRRGVRIRTIYQMPTDEDEKNWLFGIADDTAKEGMEVRVLERLPMKLMIFDWRTVLFSLEDPVSRHPSLTSAVIQHHALAQSLKILFETLWERAEDYHILKG